MRTPTEPSKYFAQLTSDIDASRNKPGRFKHYKSSIFPYACANAQTAGRSTGHAVALSRVFRTALNLGRFVRDGVRDFTYRVVKPFAVLLDRLVFNVRPASL